MRAAVAVSCLCCFVIGVAAAQDAQAVVRQATHIPAEPLDQALRTLAQERGFHIVYLPGVVGPFRSPGATGMLSRDEALTQLLSGTGLLFHYLDEETVTVVRPGSAATDRSAGDQGSSTQDGTKEGKNGSSGSFRVAQVDQGPGAAPAPVDPSAHASPSGSGVAVEEVVVTAQKREQRLQDVPIPVTALDARTLADNSQLRVQDYFASVPGLNLQLNSSSGAPMLSIRGVTTGYRSNPTVAVTVDDVPVGSSTYIGGGALSPDIDPSDLAQIEVLRGPQGALYGASSLGGLIKYVTLNPSFAGVSGRVDAGVQDVYNGAEPGYSVRGAVNVPLSDALAARASAFTRLQPGYIDNVQTGQNGANWGNAYGGHLSALWQPASQFSIKVGALLQSTETRGADIVQTSVGLAGLQQSFLRGTGGYLDRLELYSLEIKAEFAGVTLAAISGYNHHTNDSSYDVTALYGPTANKLTGYSGVPYFNPLSTDKFTQEIRLSGSIGQRLDWLAGLFYTHEHSTYSTDLGVENPATGAGVAQLINYYDPTSYTEYAGFANLTYHFTDRLDLQVGGRESKIQQTNEVETTTGLLGASTTPAYDSSNTAFTYLVTPSFKPSVDSLLYLRFASGYRPGGPNANAAFLRVPSQYDPDSTRNYDLGYKADYLNHAVSVDAALYYIDWKDVQVTTTSPSGAGKYIANGGGARSRGLELSAELRPLKGLKIAPWVAFNDATLTKNLPPAGLPGDRLPFSSRWSGNFALDQELPLTGRIRATVGGVVSYFSDFMGDFGNTRVRQHYSGYARTDLHARFRFSDTWSMNLYANNVADRRAVLFGGSDFTLGAPNSYILIQPRTVGVSLTADF